MSWGSEKKLTSADFAGLRTADTITDSSTDSTQSKAIYDTVIDAIVGACFSIHIEKDENETRYPMIRLYFHGNTHEFYDIIVNTKTGELTKESTTTSTVGTIDLDTHWRVYIAAIPADSANVFLDISIHPAAASVVPLGLLYEYWLTGSMIVSNAQLNDGLTPHTYIKTTDTIVEGAVQNLLLWSEQVEQWTGIGIDIVDTDTASAPTDDRSWPAETVTTSNWEE